MSNTEQSISEKPQLQVKTGEEVVSTPTPRAQSKERKDRSALLAVLLAVLVAVLAIMAGLAGQHFWRALEQLQAKQGQLNGIVHQQQSEFKVLRENIIKASSALDQQRGELAQMQSLVDTAAEHTQQISEKIAAFNDGDRNDWLIAEVEHYIKLADQRIELTHDAFGAANLLQHSIEVAKEIEAPGVINLRKVMIADRHMLEQIAHVDVEGIYLELSVIVQNLEKLSQTNLEWSFENAQTGVVEVSKGAAQVEPTAAIRVTAGETSERLDSEPVGASFWDQWVQFFTQHLVRVHEIDEPITPFIQPGERAYLQQNLRLLLSQAQLALMRGEGENYRIALRQARNWISRYYDSGDPVTVNIVKTLDRLLSVDINPALPNINYSLQAIRELRKNWLSMKMGGLQNRGGEK